MPLTTERQQIRGGVHRRVQSVAKGVPQAGDMGRTVVEGRSGMAGRLGELTEHVDRRLQSAPGFSSVSGQPSSPDTRVRMCRVLVHEMRAIPQHTMHMVVRLRIQTDGSCLGPYKRRRAERSDLLVRLQPDPLSLRLVLLDPRSLLPPLTTPPPQPGLDPLPPTRKDRPK